MNKFSISLQQACALKHTRRPRGSILLMTAITLFVVAAITMGALTLTTNAVYMNQRQLSRACAMNLAESGAEQGELWLFEQGVPPTSPHTFSQNLGDGSFEVTITPDPDNGTASLKVYTIVSTGSVGGVSKRVEIVVQQATFGRYAYFTDSETSSISGGAIWWKAGELVDGPVHSNNTNGSNFNINYNNSVSPIFLSMVTGSGSTINYNPGRPQDEATFRRIFADGSKGYKLGVPRVDLPESTDRQRSAAWGSSANYPTETGVYLKSDVGGGIYVVGNCEILASLDGSGNQVFSISQTVDGNPQTTTITMNKQTGTTTATGPLGPGSATSSPNLTNGVLYCTGNITSLAGVIADNWVDGGQVIARSAYTIATDVNNGKTIKITDDLEYNTQPDKSLPSDDPVNLAAGTLGLVAKDIIISSSAPPDLEIDAVCLAGGRDTSGGSFYVENYSTKTPVGTLTVTGGIIQKARGPVGTFNPYTGQTVSGYAKNYHYDPRLATQPPPYYPTTGHYERLSWRVLPD